MVVVYQPDIRGDRDKKHGFYNNGRKRNEKFNELEERQNSHNKSDLENQE